MAATATKSKAGGSSPGRGWNAFSGGHDDSAPPADPQETRLVVSLSGLQPRYVNADGSFAIWSALQTLPDGGEKAVTIKGALARCTAGEMLSCKGKWQKHKTHGWSFFVDLYESALPKTAKGVALWLERKVPGVGPTFAKAIVDHFGHDKVYELLDENPERLREVRTKKGRAINAKQVEKAIEAWGDVKAIRQIESFLFSHGVTANLADKLYRRYGQDVVTILTDDPYRITEMRGIGFKIADDIAIDMGTPLDDPKRVRAGIIHILDQAEGDGHTYLLLSELFRRVSSPRDAERDRDKGLGVGDKRVVAEQATILANERKLIAEEVERVDQHGDKQKTQRVYSRRMYDMERDLARKVRELCAPPRAALFPAPERPAAPEGATKDEVEKLRLPSDEQWSIIEQVRSNRLAILSGGPGSGKTHSQITVVELVKKSGRSFKLCAPTGKAARRMTELTGEPATTIHKLLEVNPSEGGYNRNENNPIEADLIVVDEASMLALDLTVSLLAAVGPDTHVLLVGDPDQLPPVGAGKVLDDLIESDIVPRVHLTKVFRQAAASMIVVNARLVNNGEPIFKTQDAAEKALQRQMRRDFFFIGRQEPEDTRDLVIDMVCNRIPRTFKMPDGRPMDPRKDIMVLAPMQKGVVGLEALNKALEAELNPGPNGQPRKPFLPLRGISVGSRIMQTKNLYDKQSGPYDPDNRTTMNGEIGLVLDYNENDKEALLSFDDGEREFWMPVSDMDTFVLAWACSVHKSQGSEFPAVVAPVVSGYWNMLTRGLVYTAITRAKTLCVMVGEQRALRIATSRPDMRQRNSGLAERIVDPTLSGELF